MDKAFDEIVSRIRERAANPEKRTDEPPTSRGRTVSAGGLAMIGLDLGKLLRGSDDPRASPKDDALPSPVDVLAIADAEQKLGFALPPLLVQLYSQVANGSFGPGAGIMSLQDVVETYLGLIKAPPGQRGQKWPVHLLPITSTDPGHDCVDIKSGEIIFWDEEELASGPSDKVWKKSFKFDASGLQQWFERWLSSPSPESRMQDLISKAKLDGIRQSLVYWRAKTPEERAKFGLPETGWEEKLFGHLGIDLSKL